MVRTAMAIAPKYEFRYEVPIEPEGRELRMVWRAVNREINRAAALNRVIDREINRAAAGKDYRREGFSFAILSREEK